MDYDKNALPLQIRPTENGLMAEDEKGKKWVFTNRGAFLMFIRNYFKLDKEND